MTTTILEVKGMTCQSCVRKIEDALRRDGVARVDVRLGEGRVEIEHTGSSSAAALAEAVRAAGFEVGPRPRAAARGGCCGCC